MALKENFEILHGFEFMGSDLMDLKDSFNEQELHFCRRCSKNTMTIIHVNFGDAQNSPFVIFECVECGYTRTGDD